MGMGVRWSNRHHPNACYGLMKTGIPFTRTSILLLNAIDRVFTTRRRRDPP